MDIVVSLHGLNGGRAILVWRSLLSQFYILSTVKTLSDTVQYKRWTFCTESIGLISYVLRGKHWNLMTVTGLALFHMNGT